MKDSARGEGLLSTGAGEGGMRAKKGPAFLCRSLSLELGRFRKEALGDILSAIYIGFYLSGGPGPGLFKAVVPASSHLF